MTCPQGEVWPCMAQPMSDGSPRNLCACQVLGSLIGVFVLNTFFFFFFFGIFSLVSPQKVVCPGNKKKLLSKTHPQCEKCLP